MPIPINNVPRRVVYAASGTGPYNFTFEILAATDIAVYRDNTLLTITSDYTVTINANGTGYVTLTATPTGATQIAIVGNRTIQRLTDFVTGGDFFANTLNDELDQQTIFAQQNAEGLTRALQAPISDPSSINMILPAAATRASKYLGFDASGNPAALTGTGSYSVINLAADVTGTLAVANGGTGITSFGTGVATALGQNVTGSGGIVLSTSPTLVTPTLGAASATSVALAAGAVGTPSLTATGDLNTGMWFPAADTIAWSTGGSERMRVDSSGNLGLGVTPSAWSAGFKAIELPLGTGLWADNGTPSSWLTSNLYFDGSFRYKTSAQATGYNLSGGVHRFYIAPSGTAGNAISFTQAMTLDASGNLGIGTTSPGSFDSAWQRLVIGGGSGDVGQTIYSGSASIGTMAFADGTSGAQQYAGLIRYLHASDAMTFWANADERMRINSSGNVGIGTNNPSNRLHVSSGAIDEVARFEGTGIPLISIYDSGVRQFYIQAATSDIYLNSETNKSIVFATNNFERARISSGGVFSIGDTGTGDATGAYIKATTITNSNYGVVRIQSAKTSDSADTALSVIKQANDSTTAQVFVRFVINAAANGCGQINANGANTAAFGTYSDARLKENIVDLPPQLASICALRPVEFDYIQSEGGGHQIGFIAQEMEQVYPDAVGERSDGMKTITAWSKTEARLVKAIQEQQAIIDSLVSRIAALEPKGA